MGVAIKRADLTAIENEIVKDVVKGFMRINAVHYEFSNPSDLVSMHLFLVDAFNELDSYSSTKHDVTAMKSRAAEIFHLASAHLQLEDLR